MSKIDTTSTPLPENRLTERKAAMLRHIDYIVRVEHRPFLYLDFENFHVNGRWYHIPHGSCRNIFSDLVKAGIIELEYNSKVAFYTLKGYHFGNGNKMTRNHIDPSSVTIVTNVIDNISNNMNSMSELFNYIHSIPIENAAVHDIHYKFVVPDIYKVVSVHPKYDRKLNPISKDIIQEPEVIDGLKIQTVIHRTDTVTVSIACSSSPITINEAGVLRASIALARAEERLSSKLDECGRSLPGGYEKIPIPDNRIWTVTMWHFGKDGRFEYCKKGYSLTWGYGREVLRIYTKSMQGQRTERVEIQEYPNKSFEDGIAEKRLNRGKAIETTATSHDPVPEKKRGYRLLKPKTGFNRNVSSGNKTSKYTRLDSNSQSKAAVDNAAAGDIQE